MNVSANVNVVNKLVIKLSSNADQDMLKSKSTSKTDTKVFDFQKEITDLVDSLNGTKTKTVTKDKTSKPQKTELLSTIKSLKGTTNDEQTLNLLDKLSNKISSLFVSAPVVNSNLKIEENTPNLGVSGKKSSSMADVNQKLKDVISEINTITTSNNKSTNVTNISKEDQILKGFTGENQLQELMVKIDPKNFSKEITNLLNLDNSTKTQVKTSSFGSTNIDSKVKDDNISIVDIKSKLEQILVKLTNGNDQDTAKKQNSIADTTQMFLKLSQKNVDSQSPGQLDSVKFKSSLNPDKILKSTIGKDENTKSNKVDTLFSQLNGLKQNIELVKVSDTPVINKATMVNDIIETVKFMDKNQLQELTVKLNPKDLGEVVVKLTMESGNMKAVISAGNKDTFNMLNANLKDIETALNHSEVKIQNVNISLYQENSSFNQRSFDQGGEKKNSNESSKNNSIERDSDTSIDNIPQEIVNGNNNISILA